MAKTALISGITGQDKRGELLGSPLLLYGRDADAKSLLMRGAAVREGPQCVGADLGGLLPIAKRCP